MERTVYFDHRRSVHAVGHADLGWRGNRCDRFALGFRTEAAGSRPLCAEFGVENDALHS